MTARVITTDAGIIVQALLSEWQAAGRFHHVRPTTNDRVLSLEGLTADEAERLALRVNDAANS